MTKKTETKAADDAAVKKAEAKAEREAEAAERKAQREAEKEQRKKEREEERARKAAEREAEKARKAAEREANRMPEQNGIRRPKPKTLCGQAWEVFDSISKKKGSPASIAEAMEKTDKKGLNPSNVRAEYARWRKFYGITGRVAAPKAKEASSKK